MADLRCGWKGPPGAAFGALERWVRPATRRLPLSVVWFPRLMRSLLHECAHEILRSCAWVIRVGPGGRAVGPVTVAGASGLLPAGRTAMWPVGTAASLRAWPAWGRVPASQVWRPGKPSGAGHRLGAFFPALEGHFHRALNLKLKLKLKFKSHLDGRSESSPTEPCLQRRSRPSWPRMEGLRTSIAPWHMIVMMPQKPTPS